MVYMRIAMSRILYKSLPRSTLRPPLPLINHQRHRSNKSHYVQLIELDLDTSSSSKPDAPEAAAEVITLGIRKLEDAIHSIMVRRAAPDWLPFLPGYSYWVPPRGTSMRRHSTGGVIEALGKISSFGGTEYLRGSMDDILSEDEQMSFSSTKGWPSSAFFTEGTSPIHPIPVVKVEVKIQDSENNADADDTATSEEEETDEC